MTRGAGPGLHREHPTRLPDSRGPGGPGVGSADLVEAADPHGLELLGLAAVELGDKRSGDVPSDRRLRTV